MHYVDGMTLEEVARESGLSVSGVRKRLRTLKERVRGMEVEGYGDTKIPDWKLERFRLGELPSDGCSRSSAAFLPIPD